MNLPSNCFITGLQLESAAELRDDRTDCFGYKVSFARRNYQFWFSERLENWEYDEEAISKLEIGEIGNIIAEKIMEFRYLLIGLLFDEKWIPDKTPLTLSILQNILESSEYPKTPKDKLDNLITKLFEISNKEFSPFNPESAMNEKFETKQLYFYCLYFSSIFEFRIYMNALLEKNYIISENNVKWGEGATNCQISIEGLTYLAQISESGRNSKNCFVAMSFDEDDYPIFKEAIFPACEEMGFEAKRIDYSHFESDKTINDAMIALIKKCRFMIADFTSQKHNVYFEAGYALGRGMKVIYTCKEVDFGKSSFNTNHFPHVIYKDILDLKKKLIDKIAAYIVD
jgi:hypothetical protein